MKLRLIAAFVLFLISINAYSQGWIGNSGNNLVGYNSASNLTPLNVGIGTSSPSAVLHTVGDLRFQNLSQGNANFNRLLATDINGNVRWVNSNTTSGSDQDWLTPTNGIPVNLTDNIYTQGNVGINTNTLFAGLTIQGTTTGNTLALGIRQGIDGLNGGMYIDGPNAINSGRIYFTENFLKIGRANANNANAGNAITIDAMDRVGIQLLAGSTPGANLHTLGTVRFEDLPTGVGHHLVIDAAGNVRKSGCFCDVEQEQDKKSTQQKEVQELKDKLNDLEKEMEVLRNLVLNSKEENASKNRMSSSLDTDLDDKIKIYPNPGSDLFTLDLTDLDLDLSHLRYNIVNALGVPISKTTTEVTSPKIQIDLSAFADGMYYLSIYNEGQIFSTKQLILNK